jgi:mRNA interferase HicA
LKLTKCARPEPRAGFFDALNETTAFVGCRACPKSEPAWPAAITAVFCFRPVFSGNGRKENQEIGPREGCAGLIRPRSWQGGHGRLYCGDRFTILKDRKKEIGPGLLKAMLDQLGLIKKDLEE